MKSTCGIPSCRPRCGLVRIAATSHSCTGWLTSRVQFRGRSSGHAPRQESAKAGSEWEVTPLCRDPFMSPPSRQLMLLIRHILAVVTFLFALLFVVFTLCFVPTMGRSDRDSFILPGVIIACGLLFLSGLQYFFIFLMVKHHKQQIDSKARLCTKCGYDLRATPHQCPECGTVPNNLTGTN